MMVLIVLVMSSMNACQSIISSGPAIGADDGNPETAMVPESQFTHLFDATTTNLDGWWGATTEDPNVWMALPADQLARKKHDSLNDIARHWHIERGELVNDGNGLYLTTDHNYGDFELRLDYKTVPLADSGIYLRGCPQVQIWDFTNEGGKWDLGADKGSGGLWNNSPAAPGKDPLVRADKPFGAWNSVRVILVGERVTVWLNGQLVVDHARMENYFDRSKPIPRTGPIQLQTHGGEIRWRNIRIRDIRTEEADAYLASIDAKGYTSIFNGRDFTGWTGDLAGYQVRDGAILCRAGYGGNLYTIKEYGDFQVRMEISIPPGGNNGLAIRYPGTGDPAYTGMCELQVLDSEDPRYAKLDPRQYHGSVYGQAAANRGYLRAPNEWNYQVVTVQGHTITVELNGTRILHADLSTITQFMYPEEHFAGRLRTTGHFGFAGHDDPVMFRNIEIRPMEN